MELPWQDGTLLINKALEKRNEENAFRLWTALYPNMDKETFISFDKFYDPKPKQISKKSTEEILKESLAIRDRLGQKKGGN